MSEGNLHTLSHEHTYSYAHVMYIYTLSAGHGGGAGKRGEPVEKSEEKFINTQKHTHER